MFTYSLFGRSVSALAALLSLACLPGCGGGGNEPSALVGADPTALSASATTANGLIATMTQDKASTSAGASLNYTFTLANPTPQAVMVQAFGGFNAQGVYDLSKMEPDLSFQIADASGKQVYPDPNAPQPLIVRVPLSISLPPGQAISSKMTVPSGLSPSARYQAGATFFVSGFGTSGGTQTSVGPLTISVH